MIFNRNTLEEIKDFPQSSVGAPIPVVLSDEHKLFLCYYVQDPVEGWNGTTVKMVDADTADEAVAVITFKRYRVYKFGPPNDEAITGHPLYKKGLKPYSIFKVNGSSWIEELEKMNSVHPHHDKKRFDALSHFIFVFHDSTFECVVEGISSEIKSGSVKSIVQELAVKL